jgi:ADP-heptose:LPS heptosyltransferase
MTPRERADAVVAWLGRRTLAEAMAAFPAVEADLLAHADALADAADSDDEALRGAGLGALFGGLVEPLNDGFTPAGRWLYHRLFGRICWRVCARVPALAARLAAFAIADEAALLARHARLRADPAPAPAAAARIVVPSRVTLGADVLLTTVLLQRLRARYPGAELVVLGDPKLAGLIGGMAGVRVRALSYARRGPLRERLASWLALVEAVEAEAPDLVVAPDSRLDQLGLLPVCAPERYRLWENLEPEGAAAASLADRLDAWCGRLLGGGAPCLPRLAFDAERAALAGRFRAAFGPLPLCAVKLDHGGNPAKALPRAGELHLLRGLRAKGWRILLDRGFGEAELANSDALLDALGWRATDLDDSGKGLGRAVDALAPGELAAAEIVRFHGSIGGWAAALAACGHALAYDSVGHHLAAALGVPVSIAFTGWSDPGFPVAWQPRGAGTVLLHPIPTAAKDEPARWDAILAGVPLARPAGA